jgi:hypothetical protein
MGLFARKPAAGDDVDALQADLQRLTATQSDLVAQLETARKDATTRRDAHRLALVETPESAAGLGELALAARMKVEGLEANIVDLDAEVDAAKIRLTAAQQTRERGEATEGLRQAIDKFSIAYQAAMPAMTDLINAMHALGKAQKLDHVSGAEAAANHLAHALDPFPREVEAILAAADRRVAEWRQPPQVPHPQPFEPQQLGRPVPGTARPLPVGARW